MTQQHSRRDFIKTSGALGAALWVGGQLRAQDTPTSANEEIAFACIGVGGKGSSDSSSAGKSGNIVALCDVDQRAIQKKAAQHKDAEQFSDFREMFDKMGDKIDAVTISTPDHNHTAAGVLAMRLKKHCFCQKPLTWSVYEARLMRETAEKEGVATQMGNQWTASSGLRTSVDIIKAGALGPVEEVHVWTNRPVWPQGTGRPDRTDPVPDYLNWDAWIGVAPMRPYVGNQTYHDFKWRGWLDFGTGALGDMACHTMNMPAMALDLFEPDSIQCETSGIVKNETYPKWSVITYQFPARGNRPPVKLTWYDGGKTPDASLLEGEAMSKSGCLVIGQKGKLYSPGDYGSKFVLLGGAKGYELKEPTLPRSPGHFEEFARAIRGGDPALSNFDYAGRLTETVVLGNLCLHVPGEKLEWDHEKMTVKGHPELDKFIKRDYREGWEVY